MKRSFVSCCFCAFPRCFLERSGIDLWNCTLMNCLVLSWKPSCTSGVACHPPTAASWLKSCWSFRYSISPSLSFKWTVLMRFGDQNLRLPGVETAHPPIYYFFQSKDLIFKTHSINIQFLVLCCKLAI